MNMKLLFVALAALAPASVKIETRGKLRDMYGVIGGVKGKYSLRDLTEKPHLYAIGPLDKLAGEVTVWDSKIWRTTIERGKPQTVGVPEAKAISLVSAFVEKWTELPIPAEIKTREDFEAFVEKTARDKGFSPTDGFAFRLKGKVKTADLTIDNLKDTGKPVFRPQHESSKVHLKAEDANVIGLGFYGSQSTGIFANNNTKMSLHLRARIKETDLFAHCDDFELESGNVLLLPEK